MAARARSAVALLLTLAVLAGGALASTGSAKAYGTIVPYGVVAPDGSFVLPNVQGLLSDTPVFPGTLVFGDALDIIFLNTEGNRSIEVTSFQNATPGIWLNQSFYVPGHTASLFTFNLPSSRLTAPTHFCVDDACLNFDHQTPILLFPSGILNVGGLDVLAFSITLETLVLMAPLTLWARSIARRALWVPNIKWWLVLPHVLLGSVLLVAAYFPVLDEFFGGFEFILFPLVLAVLWFFWVMHLFNVAIPAEATRDDPQENHEIDIYRWRLLVGDLPATGQRVIIYPRWRDVIARLYGHAPVIYDPQLLRDNPTRTGVPAPSRIYTLRTDTRDEKDDRQLKRWLRFRRAANRHSPFDGFPVINVNALDYREKDPPRIYYHVDYDRWLDAKPSYLSFHRDVKEPAEFNAEGKMIRPARVKSKWTWPHYVDPPCRADLSDVHWKDARPVGLGMIGAERLARRNQELRRENYALRAGVYVASDTMSKENVEEVLGLVHRERFGISVEEAREEARRGERDQKEQPELPGGPEGPEGPQGPSSEPEG